MNNDTSKTSRAAAPLDAKRFGIPRPILTASLTLSENTPALKNSTASCFMN